MKKFLCALLSVCVAAVMLAGCDAGSKNVPEYLGMTVSGDAPPSSAQTAAMGITGGASVAQLGNDTLTDADNIFTAVKNQDIYFTVNLDNPDDFVILSFTLNGEKFQSFQFEYGSTGQKLILKKNVESAGTFEYTIDAIQYVDNQAVKNVKMKGDKTVKIKVLESADDIKTPAPISDDLSKSGAVFSTAADNYGVQSSVAVQTQITMPGSESALCVTIPPNSQYSTGYGPNNDIWSWVHFPIYEILGSYSNLYGTYLTYCIKFDNAPPFGGFILEDSTGVWSAGYGTVHTNTGTQPVYYNEPLSGGWYRVYVNLSAVTAATYEQRSYDYGIFFNLNTVADIVISITNDGKNTAQPAKIYFDQVYLLDAVPSGVNFL